VPHDEGEADGRHEALTTRRNAVGPNGLAHLTLDARGAESPERPEARRANSGPDSNAPLGESHHMNKNTNTALVIIGTVVVLLLFLVFGGNRMMTGGMMNW